MTVTKENITRLVRESIEKGVVGDSLTLREELAAEVADILNEADQINEAFLPSIQKLLAKGLDRYRFMFFERGENRWIIVKAGTTIQALNFKGKEIGDPKKEFVNEEEVNAFVEELKAEKFKAVTRDGGLMRFFKSIVRGIGMIITALGAVNTLAAIVVLLFMIVLGPTVMAGFFGGAASVAAAGSTLIAFQSVAVGAGLVITGGGWLMMKLARKRFDADAAEKMA